MNNYFNKNFNFKISFITTKIYKNINKMFKIKIMK